MPEDIVVNPAGITGWVSITLLIAKGLVMK